MKAKMSRFAVGFIPEEITGKIISLSQSGRDPGLSDYVLKNHSLDRTIDSILVNIQS